MGEPGKVNTDRDRDGHELRPDLIALADDCPTTSAMPPARHFKTVAALQYESLSISRTA